MESEPNSIACETNVVNIADAKLLSQWQSGDEDAFRELLQRYSKLVWNVCRRIHIRKEEAEDAFQMTFLILAKRGDQIQGSIFGPWLYRVAYRAALQIREKSLDWPESQTLESVSDEHQALKEIETLERNLSVNEAVESLPEKLREPLILFHFQGYSRSEISAAVDIPESTVKSRLEQARGALRKKLVRRGIGASSALVVFTTATSNVNASSELLQKTFEQAVAISTPHGAQFIFDETSTLERSLFMSNQVAGAFKGATLTLLAALLIVIVSFTFNSNQAARGNSTGQNSANSDSQDKLQKSIELSSESPPTQTHITLRPALASASQDSTSTTTEDDLVTASKDTAGTRSSDKIGLQGSWTREDCTLELDESEKLLRLKYSVTIPEAGKIDLAIAGEYAELSDSIVGIILTAEVGGVPIEAKTQYAAVLGQLTDAPFALQVKMTKDTIFVKNMRVAIPAALTGEIGDASEAQALTNLLLGEYSREKK